MRVGIDIRHLIQQSSSVFEKLFKLPIQLLMETLCYPIIPLTTKAPGSNLGSNNFFYNRQLYLVSPYPIKMTHLYTFLRHVSAMSTLMLMCL